jgi:formylglycine-generating enzyme required for sulfatase activity
LKTIYGKLKTEKSGSMNTLDKLARCCSRNKIPAALMIILLLWIISLSGCYTTTQVKTDYKSKIRISVWEPFHDLQRFEEEDFGFDFRVMFDSKSVKKKNEVDVYYKFDFSDEFKQVEWGNWEYLYGKRKKLKRTLYWYSIHIPAKDLIGVDKIVLYIEVENLDREIIRYPADGSNLTCNTLRGRSSNLASDPGVMVFIPEGDIITLRDKDLAVEEFNEYQTISVSKFYIDRFEVTNKEYEEFCDSTAHARPPQWKNYQIMDKYKLPTFKPEKENYPVRGISYYDAKAYCEWVGKRLPTENEWEMAVRGSKKILFPWGDENIPNMANLNKGDSYRYTAPVRSFERGKSPYGCLNMMGNVAEYVFSPKPDGRIIKPKSIKEQVVETASMKGKSFEGYELPVYQVILKGGGFNTSKDGLTTYSRTLKMPHVPYLEAGCRCARD